MSRSDLTRRTRSFLTALSFAAWWGGLTVYALFVVPIGTEIVGSTEQGFVTQRVTNEINILAVVWLAVSFSLSRRNRKTAFLWGLQAATLAVLAGLHWKLDAMLDSTQLNITGEGFYNVHRIYLWGTALQWASGVALLWTITGPDRPVHQGDAGQEVRGKTADGKTWESKNSTNGHVHEVD